MSLAYFINTCQKEEKYGYQYVEECDSRLRSLNYEQLQVFGSALPHRTVLY